MAGDAVSEGMKRNFELDTVGHRPTTNEDRIEELEKMPDEKKANVYACAVVDKVVCDECGEQTWLIVSSGWNGTDSCHHCGEEYMVVG